MASKASSGRSRLTARVPAHMQQRTTNKSLTLDDINPGSQGVVVRYIAPVVTTTERTVSSVAGKRLAYGRKDFAWVTDKETKQRYYTEVYDDYGLEWR